MDDSGRRLGVVADLLVELVVLLRRHLRLGAQPDRLARVERLLDDLLLVVLLLLHVHDDGMLDEVGELLDDLRSVPLVEELLRVLLEMQDHVGAAGRFLARLDGEFALAVGLPAHAFVGRRPMPRQHRHAVGDHERRVEADAELADQVRAAACPPAVAGSPERPACRNGRWCRGSRRSSRRDMPTPLSQIVSVLLALSATILIFQSLLPSSFVLVLERIEAHLVDGVAGVADQFAQEDLLVRNRANA